MKVFGMKDPDDLLEFDFERVVQETETGVLLVIGEREIWLSKSQIDMREWSSIVGIPQWLAEKKGLI